MWLFQSGTLRWTAVVSCCILFGARLLLPALFLFPSHDCYHVWRTAINEFLIFVRIAFVVIVENATSLAETAVCSIISLLQHIAALLHAL